MLTAEENDLLCRVEGTAPMGALMRSHWLPACMSEEVAENDGKPVRVRMLGEDLVIFRDSLGRLGCLDEHCPHRRASLAFGRNEDCGLRCLFHGWKMDVEGNVVEMSSEPAETGFAAKVKHKAYPVREAGGMAWIYMGAAETMPEFEPPAFAPSPDARISIAKMHVACNWAQVLEGAIDSAHSSTLHSTDMPPQRVDRAMATDAVWPRPSTDKAPRLVLQHTPFGFRYAAIRRPIMNSATHDYVRTTLFVAPLTVLIPPNNRYGLVQLSVPIDDENTMFYFIAWSEGEGIDSLSWRRFCAAEPGVDVDANWRKLRNSGNDYLQDRALMASGDFTGIKGIPAQDMAMWESMGPIADRSRERLGASDLAIVAFRRQMVDAARAVASGGPAFGRTEPRVPQVKLRSFEGIVTKSTDWRTLGVDAEELALHGLVAAAE